MKLIIVFQEVWKWIISIVILLAEITLVLSLGILEAIIQRSVRGFRIDIEGLD